MMPPSPAPRSTTASATFTYNLPSPPRLPIEICEQIIDVVDCILFLDDTSRRREVTLRSCALVCRAWHPRSRMQIFKCITLVDHKSLQRFIAALDANPCLGLYVKTLHITSVRYASSSTDPKRLDIGFSPRDVFVLSPGALRGRLPSLTSIHAKWYSDEKKTVPRPLPYIPVHPQSSYLYTSFKRVRALTLSWAVFANFSDFVRVLDGFHELHTLSMSFITVDTVRWSSSSTSSSEADVKSNRGIRASFLYQLRKLNVRSHQFGYCATNRSTRSRSAWVTVI